MFIYRQSAFITNRAFLLNDFASLRQKYPGQKYITLQKLANILLVRISLFNRIILIYS